MSRRVRGRHQGMVQCVATAVSSEGNPGFQDSASHSRRVERPLPALHRLGTLTQTPTDKKTGLWRLCVEGRGAAGVIRVGEGVAHWARRIDQRLACIPDRKYKGKLRI